MSDIALPPATVTLSDGRKLAYAEQGDADGRPVFYFHGLPGSRLQRHPNSSIAERVGVRLITVDRPGIGRSDLLPERRFCDWAEDIEQLADELGLDEFAILGWSGGGPHALVCAAVMPERVTRVGLIACPHSFALRGALAGVSRGNWLLFGPARYGWLAWLTGLLWRATAGTVHEDPGAFLRRVAAQMGDRDRDTLSDSSTQEMMFGDLRETFRQGHHGVTWESKLHARPWDFELDDICAPVDIWHGGADVNVPRRMADHLAARLQRCKIHSCPQHGHFSALFEHWEQALDILSS